MTEIFHLPQEQEQTNLRRPMDGERYKTAFALEYWYVLDTVESHPPLATFHIDCPDGEKMARSLASWLNSGPEA